MSAVNKGLRKNYIIKQYEKLVEEEKNLVESMVRKAEKNPHSSANFLKEGSFINECTMISPQNYLHEYQLVYDGTDEDKLPVIATISQTEFKESLLHTDDMAVESIISFSQQIPGFDRIDRTTAKKMFFLFTLMKVQKGWHMKSHDHIHKKQLGYDTQT